MGADIRNTSKSADVQIKKQGHTTNGDFGSDPNAKTRGRGPARDISIPTAKG